MTLYPLPTTLPTAWQGSNNFSIRQYVGEMGRLYEEKNGLSSLRGFLSQFTTVSVKSWRYDETNVF